MRAADLDCDGGATGNCVLWEWVCEELLKNFIRKNHLNDTIVTIWLNQIIEFFILGIYKHKKRLSDDIILYIINSALWQGEKYMKKEIIKILKLEGPMLSGELAKKIKMKYNTTNTRLPIALITLLVMRNIFSR